jgi:hypothetical protein
MINEKPLLSGQEARAAVNSNIRRSKFAALI